MLDVILRLMILLGLHDGIAVEAFSPTWWDVYWEWRLHGCWLFEDWSMWCPVLAVM